MEMLIMLLAGPEIMVAVKLRRTMVQVVAVAVGIVILLFYLFHIVITP